MLAIANRCGSEQKLIKGLLNIVVTNTDISNKTLIVSLKLYVLYLLAFARTGR